VVTARQGAGGRRVRQRALLGTAGPRKSTAWPSWPTPTQVRAPKRASVAALPRPYAGASGSIAGGGEGRVVRACVVRAHGGWCVGRQFGSCSLVALAAHLSHGPQERPRRRRRRRARTREGYGGSGAPSGGAGGGGGGKSGEGEHPPAFTLGARSNGPAAPRHGPAWHCRRGTAPPQTPPRFAPRPPPRMSFCGGRRRWTRVGSQAVVPAQAERVHHTLGYARPSWAVAGPSWAVAWRSWAQAGPSFH
jgi:hypothetical protein